MSSSQDFFYICTCITAFVGVPANIVAVLYLHLGDHKFHESTLLLYRAVATTDLMVALALTTHAAHFLTGGKAQINNPIACEIVEFALDTGLRLLYLFLCLLAVLRAMVITFPYHNTLSRYRHTTLRVILLSVLFLSGQSLVPIVTRHYQGTGHCGVSLRDTFSDETVYKAWRICTVLIQVVLAMVVMLISNAVSIHGLLKSRTARNCARKNARTSAAATTVILTMSFFALHITGVVLMSCVFLQIQISSINYFIANGFSILSPVVDPFVYFLRLSPRCAALTRPPSRAPSSKTTQFTELVSRGSSGWNLRTKPAVFLKLSNSKEEQDNKTNGHAPELGPEQDVKTEVGVTMDVVTTV